MNASLKEIERAYALAKKYYEYFKVDTDAALETLAKVSVSIHCWQGDDVGRGKRGLFT